MSVLDQIISRFMIAAALLVSAALVMYGPAGLPWIVSTVLHLYAIAALGVTALLIYQASSRAVTAVRH